MSNINENVTHISIKVEINGVSYIDVFFDDDKFIKFTGSSPRLAEFFAEQLRIR